MRSRLSTLETCGFGVRTLLEANRLSCPRSADTALKPYLKGPAVLLLKVCRGGTALDMGLHAMEGVVGPIPT